MPNREETFKLIEELMYVSPGTEDGVVALQAADMLNRYAVEVAQLEAKLRAMRTAGEQST